jgi:hypothetical protein
MLTAIHTRDLLKHTPALELSVPGEREQLLSDGFAAAKKVADPALIDAFAELGI